MRKKTIRATIRDRYVRASNWCYGWRRDLDGWWVRAKKPHDELIFGNSHRGFLSEACIAVMTPEDCYRMDRSMRP